VTVRTYELRVYTLATEKALTAYLDVHYPRHQVSLPRFGIAVHGYWSAVGTDAFQLYVLVSYPDGADPAELNLQYMTSPDIAEDMDGFERTDILDVTATLLAPAAGSPLL
jgi:NIPSNAP